MPAIPNEVRALRYMKAFEDAGKTVRRVVIDGSRVEVELDSAGSSRNIDSINMNADEA